MRYVIATLQHWYLYDFKAENITCDAIPCVNPRKVEVEIVKMEVELHPILVIAVTGGKSHPDANLVSAISLMHGTEGQSFWRR